MAESSDVADALVGLLAGVLYPNGTASPSAVGVPCRVYRGWPSPKGLQDDLRAGIINVTVTPLGVVRNVTRYTPDPQQQTLNSATVAVTFTSTTVTIGGTVGAGQNVAVIVGGNAFTYTTQASDTLNSIAAALATLISAKQSATSSGATITIPNALHLNARVGGSGTVIQMVSQQVRNFMVNLWCPTPALRDTAGRVINPTLGATPRLIMPDTTTARLQLVNDGDDDDGQQKEQVYRRFITYSGEYASTLTQTATQVVAETISVSGGPVQGATQSLVTVSQ